MNKLKDFLRGYNEEMEFPDGHVEECKRILKLERKIFLGFIFWLPYGLVIILPGVRLAEHFLGKPYGDYAGMALAIPYMLCLAAISLYVTFLDCPKCHKSIFRKNMFWINMYRDSCINCKFKFRPYKGFSILNIFKALGFVFVFVALINLFNYLLR